MSRGIEEASSAVGDNSTGILKLSAQSMGKDGRMSNGSKKALDIKAMKPADLATLLSSAYRRKITEQQVREVAEVGSLLSADGTINLIQYTAFLAGEVGARGN